MTKLVPGQSKPLEWALKHIEKGFYVFPLVPRAKVPIKGMEFKKMATRDPAQVREWWGRNPHYNIGIYAGRFKENEALVIVDVDVSNGKQGEATLLELELNGKEFPKTFEQASARGGRHLIYKCQEQLGGGVNVLGPGVDIKARGGYAVAAGSSFEGKHYTANFSIEIAERPPWLVDFLKARTVQEKSKEPDVVDESEVNIERIVDYLKNDAEIAVKGDGGDHTTYKVAASVKDFGVSAETCLDLMLEHWNPRCPPGWSPEKLQTKIENAYKYGKNEIGSANPEKDFEIIDGPEVEAKEKENPPPKAKVDPLSFVEFSGDIKIDLTRPALVKGLLKHNQVSMLLGAYGEGKSAVALTLCMAIARGIPFFGLKVDQGFTVYLASEAPDEMRARILAYEKQHNVSNIPFALVPINLKLSKEADKNKLADILKAIKKERGVEISLVVIDTVAETMLGDENSVRDTQVYMDSLKWLRTEIGTHVMALHHKGKNAKKGDLRGSSNFGGIAESVIDITEKVISESKQKSKMNGEQNLRFEIKGIELCKDSDGDPVSVQILEEAGPLSDFDIIGENLEKFKVSRNIRNNTMQSDSLDILDDLIKKVCHHRYSGTLNGLCFTCFVNEDEWRKEVIERLYTNIHKSEETGAKAFRRAKADLVKKYAVHIHGGFASLRDPRSLPEKKSSDPSEGEEWVPKPFNPKKLKVQNNAISADKSADILQCSGTSELSGKKRQTDKTDISGVEV